MVDETSRVFKREEVLGEGPGMLESHSCVKMNDNYIVYGGVRLSAGSKESVCSKEGEASNEMYSMSVEGHRLEELRITWTRIEFPRGVAPCLHSHLCIYYKKDILLVIGGEEFKAKGETEDTANFSNTVYRFNLRTKMVSILQQDSHEFRPRIAHAGVSYKDKIYIFGGLEKNKLFNNQLLMMSVHLLLTSDSKKKRRA